MIRRSLLSRVLFWLAMVLLLTVTFGYSAKEYSQTFFYVASLLPVAVGTSYTFNHILVPHYLQKGKYLKFSLYLFYAIIISLWLEMIIAMLDFIYQANYNYANMDPQTTNVVYLGLSLYFIVFLDSFRLNFFKLRHQQKKIDEMIQGEREQFITVRVNRKNLPLHVDHLLYIESLADYVKIHTDNGTYITRERISSLAEKLPPYFLRIHRSFLVNTRKVDSFTKEFVYIKSDELPISRTYKEKTIDFWKKKETVGDR